MAARIFLIITVLVWGLGNTCSGYDEDASLGDDCPGSCPSGTYAVDYCPAFTDCQQVSTCGEELVCAPEPTEDAGNFDDAESADCNEPLSCPEGTLKVSTCPEDQLCTRISRCDETILCLESELLCDQQPLCPDGDRPLEDCEDEEQCYRHNHCSGPVDCLRCDENLPTGCPEDTLSYAPEVCELTGACERVDTCQATLWCQPPEACQLPETCPEGTEKVDACDDEYSYPACFQMQTCTHRLSCQATDPDCDGIPVCPEGHTEISLEECLGQPMECDISALCGQAIGCLRSE